MRGLAPSWMNPDEIGMTTVGGSPVAHYLYNDYGIDGIPMISLLLYLKCTSGKSSLANLDFARYATRLVPSEVEVLPGDDWAFSEMEKLGLLL